MAPLSQPMLEAGLPPTGTYPGELRCLRLRHARCSCCGSALGSRVDLADYALLDLIQIVAHNVTLLLQILLVQTNRIAFAPVRKQLSRKRFPRLRFVVCGVTTHTKSIDEYQRRTAATASTPLPTVPLPGFTLPPLIMD